MANINKPTFGAATMPFPSEASIAPVWVQGENLTLGGKSRKSKKRNRPSRARNFSNRAT